MSPGSVKNYLGRLNAFSELFKAPLPFREVPWVRTRLWQALDQMIAALPVTEKLRITAERLNRMHARVIMSSLEERLCWAVSLLLWFTALRAGNWLPASQVAASWKHIILREHLSAAPLFKIILPGMHVHSGVDLAHIAMRAPCHRGPLHSPRRHTCTNYGFSSPLNEAMRVSGEIPLQQFGVIVPSTKTRARPTNFILQDEATPFERSLAGVADSSLISWALSELWMHGVPQSDRPKHCPGSKAAAKCKYGKLPLASMHGVPITRATWQAYNARWLQEAGLPHGSAISYRRGSQQELKEAGESKDAIRIHATHAALQSQGHYVQDDEATRHATMATLQRRLSPAISGPRFMTDQDQFDALCSDSDAGINPRRLAPP